MSAETETSYRKITAYGKDLFLKKLADYGPSWRYFRFMSLMDQIAIKARRIRRLETLEGSPKIHEDREGEYVGIINYALIALDLLMHEGAQADPIRDEIPARWATAEAASASYDAVLDKAFELMQRKNHDYDEAWREMEPSSLTDELLCRVARIKHMAARAEGPTVSEGLEAQLFDAINYSIFALILLGFDRKVTSGR